MCAVYLNCQPIHHTLHLQAAGLATMIAAMRPDIDNIDEYVRNTTARAFSVVASALGIPALLPFLKAVCLSKKSWQARHTGIKIVQQISILMGCAVLPHLKVITCFPPQHCFAPDSLLASYSKQHSSLSQSGQLWALMKSVYSCLSG